MKIPPCQNINLNKISFKGNEAEVDEVNAANENELTIPELENDKVEITKQEDDSTPEKTEAQNSTAELKQRVDFNKLMKTGTETVATGVKNGVGLLEKMGEFTTKILEAFGM